MTERKIKQIKIKQRKNTSKHCNIFVTKTSFKFNNACKPAWLYTHTHTHTHLLPYIDNKNKFYIIFLVQRTCHGKQKRKLQRRKDTSKEKTLAKRKQKKKIQERKKDKSKMEKEKVHKTRFEQIEGER